MNKIMNTNTIFESIKHVDEEGREYWLARDLQKALGYKEWRKFERIITKAKTASTKSNVDTYRQFV